MNETETGEYVYEICGERFEAEQELERHIRDLGLVH